MKRTFTPNSIVAAALGALLLASGGATAGIKCWTNNEGVRECGNAVPPEYAQKSHDEVSKQGVTLRRSERAKTRDELRKAEAERLRREEQQRQTRVRAKHDRVLLSTFTTEEDMTLTRNGQLVAIDTRIKHTERVVAGLEKKKRELEEQAAKQERSGKAVSAELRDGIAAVDKRIAEHRDYIAKRHDEKVEINTRFETDLARYRELKAGKPIGSP